MHFLRADLGSPVPNLQPGGVTLVLEDESLLRLPDDILVLICSYCDQQSLKHLRRSCQRFAALAEAELFRELVIVPEWECIRTIRSIRKHPTIYGRVKTVVYDLRMLDSFASPGSDEDDPSDEPLIPNESLVHYFPQLKRICLTDGRDRWGKQGEVHSLFRKAIEFRNSELVQPMNLPHYTEATFKLLAEGSTAVDDLELNGVPWTVFCENYEGLDDMEMARAFGSLKSLRIYFESAPLPRDEIPLSFLWLTHGPHKIAESYSRLGRLLRTASELERLEIRFRYYPEWYRENLSLAWSTELLPAHVLGSESFYSRLKHLQVDTYISTGRDWLSFFEHHARTLVSLDLGSIRLQCSSHSFQANEGSPCWVDVLKKMQRLLRLKRINFNGTLISGSRRWYIKDSRKAYSDFVEEAKLEEMLMWDVDRTVLDKSYPIVGYTNQKDNWDLLKPIYYDKQFCLKTQVEIWFVNGGLCPLERAAVKYSETKRPGGKSTVDPTWSGDYSFRIVEER